jgi:hypothetical protein
MVLTQEFADNLKSQPLEVQSMEILKILDSDVDIIKNRDILMQFEDILRDYLKTLGDAALVGAD